MDERQRRIGVNEAAFRAVNEQIDALSQRFGMQADRLEFICECGNAACAERVHVEPDAYARLRADGARFFVVPGHELPDTEDVVEQYEDYLVVRKHEDGPAQLARRTDPR